MTCHQRACDPIEDRMHCSLFFIFPPEPGVGLSVLPTKSAAQRVQLHGACFALSNMDVTTTYTRHAAQRRSPMLTRAGEEHLTAVHRPVTSKAKSPGECSNRLETRASLHTSARERSSSTTPGEFLPKFKGTCC